MREPYFLGDIELISRIPLESLLGIDLILAKKNDYNRLKLRLKRLKSSLMVNCVIWPS